MSIKEFTIYNKLTSDEICEYVINNIYRIEKNLYEKNESSVNFEIYKNFICYFKKFSNAEYLYEKALEMGKQLTGPIQHLQMFQANFYDLIFINETEDFRIRVLEQDTALIDILKGQDKKARNSLFLALINFCNFFNYFSEQPKELAANIHNNPLEKDYWNDNLNDFQLIEKPVNYDKEMNMELLLRMKKKCIKRKLLKELEEQSKKELLIHEEDKKSYEIFHNINLLNVNITYINIV